MNHLLRHLFAKHPKHERRKGWVVPPLDFEIFSKKRCFLSFEWEKSNFTTFGPLEKI